MYLKEQHHITTKSLKHVPNKIDTAAAKQKSRSCKR